MTCMNFAWLILAYFVMATSKGLTGISVSPLLKESIPEAKTKSEIFSHIDGKGYSKYCYFAAISKILAGYLYTINPYIPLFLCILMTTFSILIARNFVEIDECKEDKKEITSIKENIIDVKDGLIYIFKSERLKALLLMMGIIWGLFELLSTYQTTLLKNMQISATYIGMIAALVQIITGITSKKANEYNSKLKNKSLTIIALGLTIGAILIGITTTTNIPVYIQIPIIIIIFCIRHAFKGFFQVIKKRYMGNFATDEILPKIYATNSIATGVFNALIGYIGSVTLLYMDIQHSTLLMGIIFTIVVIMVYFYMKPRIGIEIKKEDSLEH